jgi:hypothetical protein
MWTRFMDMHSGGDAKTGDVFIEAPEAQARAIFTARFDRDPDHVTCTCCGRDYSVFGGSDGPIDQPTTRPIAAVITAADIAAGGTK